MTKSHRSDEGYDEPLESESGSTIERRLKEPIESDYLRIQGDEAHKFSPSQFWTDLPYSFFS